MTENEIREIAEKCADKLEEVPDGFEITTAMLVHECGFKIDFDDMMRIDFEIRKAARARKIKLDSSKHDGLVEGLPFNLDFAVYHKGSSNKRNANKKISSRKRK